MPSLPWSPDQIATVRSATFPMQRGGYAEDDVRRQLDRIALTMERGRPVPEIPRTAIRRLTFAPGAAVDSVQGLLHQVRLWQQDLLAAAAATDAAATPGNPTGAESAAAGEAGDDDHTPPPPRWTAAQVDWVRDSRFGTRTGKHAYVEQEVDDFLDQVLVAMARGDDLPDIDAVLFYPPRRTGRGYDALQVDAFLDQLARLRPLRDDPDPAAREPWT